ncbi:hypothetical protein RZS08_18365, partial [Arthrospira platensis SPKY1]|nr:hypothetical protein [Arthrospira platensis SPKY1]
RFGALMYQTHEGLRDDYEVSCAELDTLVEATRDLDGVLGARMMGGGFGGCTINLVRKDRLDACKVHIGAYYEKATGDLPAFHVVQIGPGTRVLDGVMEGQA